MIVNGLRHLKFTGGEPLMVPSVKKLIDYCVDNDFAKNINLMIITNVTLINDEWIGLFKAFKFVNIICSIDGIGDTFEYIRHPANWNDVNSKLQKLSKVQTEQLVTSTTFTLQAYNILEIKNIVELAKQYNFHINVIPLDAPAYLDVRNVPQDLKDEALRQINTLSELDNKKFSKFLKDVKNKINQPTNEDNSKQFIEVTKLKDTYKKQSFATMEIARYYD